MLRARRGDLRIEVEDRNGVGLVLDAADPLDQGADGDELPGEHEDGEQQGLGRGEGAQRQVAGEYEQRARGKGESQSERVREGGDEAEALAVHGEGRPGVDGL